MQINPRKYLKKNFAIVLAFALPIALIVIVTLSAYLPSLFVSTDYNFVYAICEPNSYYNKCQKYLSNRYLVVDNKLVYNAVDPIEISFEGDRPKPSQDYITSFSTNDSMYDDEAIRLYLHDTKKDQSRELTLEEAQTLTLSSHLTSPDKVSISTHYNQRGDFIFFSGGRSQYNHYLTTETSRKKLNIMNQNAPYYELNFQFIGWVLPGRQ
jgi:hypothetical protein